MSIEQALDAFHYDIKTTTFVTVNNNKRAAHGAKTLSMVTLSFSVSAFTSLIIIAWFGRVTTRLVRRNDTSAVQASHAILMVRVGGVAIAISLIAAAACSYSMNGWSDFDLLLVSALPVFSVGLAEDLGYFARPRRRLFTQLFRELRLLS